MAGPSRSAGAGRAERESYVAQIGDQPRAISPVAADVEVPVITAVKAAVDGPFGTERVAGRDGELADMVLVAGRALPGELRRRAETDAQRG